MFVLLVIWNVGLIGANIVRNHAMRSYHVVKLAAKNDLVPQSCVPVVPSNAAVKANRRNIRLRWQWS